MHKISLDFETCSAADLKKTGAWRYAEDPNTQILCAAYAVDDGPIHNWLPGQPAPECFDLLVSGKAVLCAWNAEFEVAIWRRIASPQHGWPPLNPQCVRDTMAQSAFAGFPLSLDEATKALSRGSRTKDMGGHRLMLRMSKPRDYDEETGEARWWHEEDPDRYTRLIAYCMSDVEEERKNRHLLPELPQSEQSTWLANLLMNMRGVAIDTALVRRLNALAEEVTVSRYDKKLAELTDGFVIKCSNAGRILKWAQQNGLPEATSLARDALHGHILEVQDLVDSGNRKLAPLLAVLKLRQVASRSSTKKLNAMLRCLSPWDDRARGVFAYYGATRTGRWAGRLYQPQNLPRGDLPKSVDPTELADRLVRDDGLSLDDLEQMSEREPLLAISSLVRSCQVGRNRHGARVPLVVGDYSQIEARVVAWICGQNDIVDVFASGRDVYTYTAERMGSDSRQLGKVCVLGLGYQMGADRFMDTAAAAPYFLKFNRDQAQQIVWDWRDKNHMIAAGWKRADEAFRAATQGRTTKALKCTFAPYRDSATAPGTFNVAIWLPGGRPLIYRDCQIRPGTKWEGHTQLSYMGIDQTTRRWSRINTYGGNLVENITQAIARDLMANALVRLERKALFEARNDMEWSMRPVLTVHDEIGAEFNQSLMSDDDAVAAMSSALVDDLPPWAAGLPVAADCGVLKRYRK
ncbi:MAG: DNA polymerase [Pseudomonadota bacterium]